LLNNTISKGFTIYKQILEDFLINEAEKKLQPVFFIDRKNPHKGGINHRILQAYIRQSRTYIYFGISRAHM
jgi:hypothetical protein